MTGRLAGLCVLLTVPYVSHRRVLLWCCIKSTVKTRTLLSHLLSRVLPDVLIFVLSDV